MFEREIDAGVALLDDHEPEWLDRIQPERLNLMFGDTCILGQAYWSYSRGLQILFGPDAMSNGQWGQEYGFSLPSRHEDETSLSYYRRWETLTTEWRDIVRHLQAVG